MANRDGWERPDNAKDENVHLMVQCTETWFLADRGGLAAYFCHGFNRNALPGRREIEDAAKADVLDGLKNAPCRCKKGEYGKGRHSFDILKRIDSSEGLVASPQAKRLIDTLREKAT